MARVFISCKRADKEKVWPLKVGIETAIGEKCWIDYEGTEVGNRFVDVQEQAIDEAQIFIYVYSMNSTPIENDSNDWNIKELNYAKREGKRIVVLTIDKVAPQNWIFPIVDATEKDAYIKLINDIKGWLENDDVWVFISHSSKDFNKVRIVRNALEKKGYRPILLYLKCMEDKDEIDSLLKREIDARRWFILCDSANAKQSKFVQSEVSYIQSIHRQYDIIDVNNIDTSNPEIEHEVLNLLQPFRKRQTIYLNHSRNDWAFAKELTERLRTLGYTVLSLENVENAEGRLFAEVVQELIRKAGYFISLINSNWINSPFTKGELEYAYRTAPERIYPVIIDNTNLDELPLWLRSYNILNVSAYKSPEQKTEAIVNKLQLS